MDKPRIFLGSSGLQKKLLQALTRGLEDVAHVVPWTTSFNPGTTTLARLFELAHEVDFAAFAFARDDWTAAGCPRIPSHGIRSGFSARQCRLRSRPFRWGPRNAPNLHPPRERLEASERSPRVYMRTVRRSDNPSEMRVVNQKLRKAIENEGRIARIEGLWWQFSLTARTLEPSAVSLMRISRDRDGALELRGRSWQEDGSLSTQILERSGEGEEGAFWRFLLLEGRTAPGPERTAAGGDRRNPAGVRRSRGRVLHNSFGCARKRERADGRCLLSRRSRGHGHPGRKRRSATRGIDRRAADSLEVDHERLRSAV